MSVNRLGQSLDRFFGSRGFRNYYLRFNGLTPSTATPVFLTPTPQVADEGVIEVKRPEFGFISSFDRNAQEKLYAHVYLAKIPNATLATVASEKGITVNELTGKLAVWSFKRNAEDEWIELEVLTETVDSGTNKSYRLLKFTPTQIIL